MPLQLQCLKILGYGQGQSQILHPKENAEVPSQQPHVKSPVKRCGCFGELEFLYCGKWSQDTAFAFVMKSACDKGTIERQDYILIDKTLLQFVAENIRPSVQYTFCFICLSYLCLVFEEAVFQSFLAYPTENKKLWNFILEFFAVSQCCTSTIRARDLAHDDFACAVPDHVHFISSTSGHCNVIQSAITES